MPLHVEDSCGRTATYREGVAEVLYEGGLLVAAQYEVDAVDVGDVLWSELGVAPCHHYEGSRMLLHHLAYLLAALAVCHLRHGAGVDEAYVGCLALVTVNVNNPHLLQHFCECGGL